MQSEIFKFKAATTQESMNGAVQVLSGVEGVGAVEPSLLRNEVNVQFDPQLASKQSLQAVLLNAGYAVQNESRTAGCGGSGGCTCS